MDQFHRSLADQIQGEMYLGQRIKFDLIDVAVNGQEDVLSFMNGRQKDESGMPLARLIPPGQRLIVVSDVRQCCNWFEYFYHNGMPVSSLVNPRGEIADAALGQFVLRISPTLVAPVDVLRTLPHFRYINSIHLLCAVEDNHWVNMIEAMTRQEAVPREFNTRTQHCRIFKYVDQKELNDHLFS